MSSIAIEIRRDYGKARIKGVSYYCAHCSVVLEIMAIEKAGFPAWVSEPQPEGRCIQYLYKKPENVPEKYYERVGMKKGTLKLEISN